MAESSAAAKRALAPIPVKSVASEDLIERFNRVQNEIANRAFCLFESDGRTGRDLENWFKAESEVLDPVRVTVTEADEKLYIEAEVPGFELQDLDIAFEPQRLIISGTRETKEEKKNGKTIYSEQRSNEIFRAISLPVEVDASKASASLNNGILTLEVPKSAKAPS
jgi:HSP20 family protein